jgi:glycosyltransferase involved in cell wall biosynthesis
VSNAGRRVRVLHMIPAVAPRYGGPSAAIGPMLRAIHETGDIDLELVTTDADGVTDRLGPDRVPKYPFPVHVLPGPSESDTALRKWVRENVHRFDLVAIHSLWNAHGRHTMTAARNAGVPYVIRTCGMLAPYSWRRRWWKKRPYWWLYERRNVRAAAALHVTSPGERDEVAAWHLPGTIHEIPLGLDGDAFAVPRDGEALRMRCGPAAGDRPIVLFLGRLHPVKGITDCLLPALSRMTSDCYLALVGGPVENVPGYEAEIRTTVARLGLTDRVALLGPVQGREKWACYDGAAVTVQPSHTENFGLSVAEAMARSCPVVVTEGVQSRSVVESSGGGWVVPFDPARLAATLDTALADSTGTSSRGRAGHDYVKRELAWDRIAAKLTAMYRSVTLPKR